MVNRIKINQIEEKCAKINGYIRTLPNNRIAKLDKALHITFTLYGISSDVIYIKQTPYFAVRLNIQTSFGTRELSNYVYVANGGRPNVEWISKRFSEILANPFPGTFEIISDRYVFQLQRTPDILIESWLHSLKFGKSTLDQSWLAPLQELNIHLESKKLSVFTHKGKKSRTKASTAVDTVYWGDGDPLERKTPRLTARTFAGLSGRSAYEAKLAAITANPGTTERTKQLIDTFLQSGWSPPINNPPPKNTVSPSELKAGNSYEYLPEQDVYLDLGPATDVDNFTPPPTDPDWRKAL